MASNGYFLRVRGLPWTATKREILQFFNDCDIIDGEEGIHMTLARGGRPSGECYIEFTSEEEMEKGFKKHKRTMGHRYVEIFKSERSEMEWVCRKNGGTECSSGYVWLRGIPFGCSKEEIAQFFSGLKIVPNGITLPADETGRSTGEAYVQFASKEIAEKAMGKHKEKIGHRYIEIFQSSQQEVRNAMRPPRSRPIRERPGPYSRNDRSGGGPMGGGRYGMNRSRNMKSYCDDNIYDDYNDDYNDDYQGDRGGRFSNMGGRSGSGGGGGPPYGRNDSPRRNEMGMRGGNQSMNMDDGPPTHHIIHMRGLPFRASDKDVADFFKPIPVADMNIRYWPDGRASGKADVCFYTHQDAVKAMRKDKQNMQHRYVELFLESEPTDDFGEGNDIHEDPEIGGAGGGGRYGNRRNVRSNNFGGGMNRSGNGSGNFGGNNSGNFSGRNMQGNYQNDEENYCDDIYNNLGGNEDYGDNANYRDDSYCNDDDVYQGGNRGGSSSNNMMGNMNNTSMSGMNRSMVSGMNNSPMSSGMSNSNMGGGLNSGNMVGGMNSSNMGGGMNSSNMGGGMNSSNMGVMGSGNISSGMSPGNMGVSMNSGSMGGNMNSGSMGGSMNSGSMGGNMNSGSMGGNMNSGSMGSGMNTGMNPGMGTSNAGMNSTGGGGMGGNQSGYSRPFYELKQGYTEF